MTFINPAKFGRIDPTDWKKFPEHYTRSFWPENLPHPPSEYGMRGFHGRTHPEIVFVALDRYTKPGDVVWDCFAGGGTTIDVCVAMDNVCIANDILPTRPDVIEADSRTWCPDQMVDLVICHPPYMNVIQWEATGTLSVGDVESWLIGMNEVLGQIGVVLRPWHVLVMIVGQVYIDGQMYALDMELWPLLLDRYRLLGRVVRGFGETDGGETGGVRNENLWKYRRLKYGIWALGIDSVLWLQKLG